MCEFGFTFSIDFITRCEYIFLYLFINRGNKTMKYLQGSIVIIGMLLLNGCGDQIWCGENGCGANRSVSTPTVPIDTQSIYFTLSNIESSKYLA